MCGICGIACDRDRPIERETLDSMTDVLRHRGPDSRGIHISPGIGLGVRRLSIIDVSGGDQPIYSEDGSITLACNGEIYNCVELRAALEVSGHQFRTNTDVEVILHLFEDHGINCVKRLRGMFTFALWDSRNRSLFLARDRFGIKPLFYHLGCNEIAFGSEIKAILLSKTVKPSMDPLALNDLMTLGFVRTPRTFIEGISALPPGHILKYHDGRASLSRYWQIAFPAKDEYSAASDEHWGRLVREKLDESVRLHIRSDVPVGVWLSAGLDSSSIACLAGRHLEKPINTYSLEFEDAAFNEIRSARTLDRFDGGSFHGLRAMCGTAEFNNFSKAVWFFENISTSGIEVATMALSGRSAHDVKVVLTGEGADEIFGGYSWFRLEKLLRPMVNLPLWMRQAMLAGGIVARRWPGAARAHVAPARMSLERYQSLMGSKMPESGQAVFSGDLKLRIADRIKQQAPEQLPDDFAKWHPFAQLQFFELSVRLPSFIVHGLDRASMANSVEARVPFLDHELVELAAQIPPAVKMRRLREKHVLREAMKNLLPREIVNRRKRGLAAPYQSWMRGPLPGFALEALSDRSLKEKGYFEPRGVRDLMQRHRMGQGNFGGHLLAVLIGQLWDEIFLRSSMEAPAI